MNRPARPASLLANCEAAAAVARLPAMRAVAGLLGSVWAELLNDFVQAVKGCVGHTHDGPKVPASSRLVPVAHAQDGLEVGVRGAPDRHLDNPHKVWTMHMRMVIETLLRGRRRR